MKWTKRGHGVASCSSSCELGTEAARGHGRRGLLLSGSMSVGCTRGCGMSGLADETQP